MLSPPPCPHLRSEWVGLPETQHFWNLNTYLHARPLNPGSFYGHIFPLLKAVYSILHLDFEAKIIIFFGITYLAIRGGLSFNRIFIWIRSLQTFTTWHFHLLLLLLLQWCYSNSRGDQQKVNIFAKKKQTKRTHAENCVVCHGFTSKHELMNENHIYSLLDSDERVFDTCNGGHLGAMQQSQVPSAVW